MSFEIVKVIIKGNIPINCFHCRGAVRDLENPFKYKCGAVLRELTEKEFAKRPDWCPLVLEGMTEREWNLRNQTPYDTNWRI